MKNILKTTVFFIGFVLFNLSTYSQVTVNSLSELMSYLDDDNANVKLTAGTYWITEEDAKNGLYETGTDIVGRLSKSLLLFAGNNSTYDFTDVTINIETKVFQAYGSSYQVYETRTTSLLGMEESIFKTGKIYPNPVMNQFTITNSMNYGISIYDISGRLMMSSKVGSNSEPIDISNFNSGIYFIQLENKGKVSSKKIIKE